MNQLEFEMGFSDSEKQIAKYILTHDDEVLGLSSRELASVTYTSPATIVRLCRKLGLSGYDDFKIKYSAELQSRRYSSDVIDVNYPFKKGDDLETISHNLLLMHNEVLRNTSQLLDYHLINQVVDLLCEYKEIDVYGNGNSLLAALAFEHKMMRIGRKVNMNIINGEQIFMAYNSDQTHLTIIISYSGETDDLIRVAKVIKEKGSKIILLTSVGDNQLSRIADHIITIDSKEKLFSKIAPFASQLCFEYVLDILYSGVFVRSYDSYIEQKISFDKGNDKRSPLNSPIKEQ